jgi:hypothetical protein
MLLLQSRFELFFMKVESSRVSLKRNYLVECSPNKNITGMFVFRDGSPGLAASSGGFSPFFFRPMESFRRVSPE